MKRPIKILIACGSGIATSSYAEAAVREICDNGGYKVKITKGSIQEAEEMAKAADLVLFTSGNWSQYILPSKIHCPAMSVSSLLIGIKMEKTIEQLKEHLTEIDKSINNVK